MHVCMYMYIGPMYSYSFTRRVFVCVCVCVCRYDLECMGTLYACNYAYVTGYLCA